MRTHRQSIRLFLAICACGNLSQAATVSYLQPPLAGGDGYFSTPSEDQRADNFSFAQKTKVTTIRWWGTYLNNPPSASDPFTLRFFAPDPLAGSAPQQSPTNQFTNQAITRTNSGLVDSFGDPIYRYEATLSTPVIFSAGALNYVSVLNGSSNPWFWQKSSNAGSNWFRLDEGPESTWFPASGSENIGNLAFDLIGITPPPGDYNADFTVNRTDYNLWRQNYGSTMQTAADGNFNGVVDAADYVAWRKNFGTALGGSDGTLAAVPEASSRALMFIAAMVLVLVIRLRARFGGRRLSVIADPASIYSSRVRTRAVAG